MDEDRCQIDEYALAAFICGKVPGKIREQIIESLVNDADARQLLAMAYDALTTVAGPDDAMRYISRNWKPAA